MPGRYPGRSTKPCRAARLELERLEEVCLLSGGGVHHSLGSVIAPSLVMPRISQPMQVVDPHVALNNYMTSVLGPSIQPIQQAVENQNTSQHSLLVEKILADPFVHSVLGDQDVYTLLNSSGMNSLVGFSNASSQGTVTYIVPATSVLSIGDTTSTVSIPSSGNLPGFIVQVPTTGLRTLSDGTVAVQVPTASIPANAPPPSIVGSLTGSLADVFSATGPLIYSALQTGLPLRTPNAPLSVPGLRLARVPTRDRILPLGSMKLYLRMFRIAVERGVFNLDATQAAKVQAGVQQFNTQVSTLNQQGAFTPAVPPAAPPLPGGPLGGTLAISIGALRNLVNVGAGQNGLPLPQIGNFPGRIDAGFVISRNGDYGLILTLRGALSPAPQVANTDKVGSTIQIEASNARSLTDLNGLRNVEGLAIGTALMGTLTNSRTASGVSTFASSAGYGAGLEYGTGVGYSLVIPLGNLNALIPQSPPRG